MASDFAVSGEEGLMEGAVEGDDDLDAECVQRGGIATGRDCGEGWTHDEPKPNLDIVLEIV